MKTYKGWKSQIYKQWKRREWDAVPADPTAALQWELKTRYLRIWLRAIWDLEAEVTVLGRTWRTVNAKWAQWLMEKLEDKWQADHDYSEDPMGEHYRGYF
jgi:hypothetical protein